jgi:glycerol-3-phosphate dehydrogenase
MVARAVEMIPELKNMGIRASYMSARPLIQTGSDARSLSRTFKCFDHLADNNLRGFVTITGGKATTCRVMAEKTADVVCAQFNIKASCQTAESELDPYRTFYSEQVTL